MEPIVGDRCFDVGLLGLVVFVAGQLVEHLDVGELLGERVEHGEIVTDVGVLGVELLRAVLVVPERRIGDLRFEHGEPLAVVGDRQVRLGLGETATDVAEVRGEVAHDVVAGRVRRRRGTA